MFNFSCANLLRKTPEETTVCAPDPRTVCCELQKSIKTFNFNPLLSVQTAGVVLERSHVDLIAQPLDLEILEMVIFVILNDYFLQFVDLALHPGSQLSLHLQQSLSKGKDQ